MPKASKGGFYAVKVGKVPGVYNTWYVEPVTLMGCTLIHT
jgi:viroplasmin and RNaseH domain-containing protein